MMNAFPSCRFTALARLLPRSCLYGIVLLVGLTVSGFSAEKLELDKLFRAAAGADDETARSKLVTMGDEAVEFLCGVLITQEQHSVEYDTDQGHQKTMGTWSQDASGILAGIGTPKVVAAARQLAVHEDPDVRYWGLKVLQGCVAHHKEILEFFRTRLVLESGACLEEIIGFIAERRAPVDLPVFQKLAESQADVHLKLVLWYALALQGEKDPLLEIVKVCGQQSGHLGVVYLRRATGQDFGWNMDAWRKWLDRMPAGEFRKWAGRAKPIPLPPPPPGRPVLSVPESATEEIKEALAWFASLDPPSTKGLTRVRIVDEFIEPNRKDSIRHQITGWQLEKKNGTSRILAGPDVEAPFFWSSDGAWPLQEWKVQEYNRKRNNGWREVRRVEMVDFKAEVESLLAKPNPDRFGKVLSQQAAYFLLGRDCLEQELPELAMNLLNRAPMLNRDVNELRSFGQMLADEFAEAALWKITLQFSDPAVSRTELLTQLEAALKHFPTSRSVERMNAMAERLRIMVKDDLAHARTAKPLSAMTPDEQAEALVYQLRDQTGYQDSQPGWCDIFSGENESSESAAAKLVKLGHRAVPALIRGLASEEYSRSIGFWRNFRFSHHVLTVGDCSLQVLEKIAQKQFFRPKTTSSYMSKDEQLEATRSSVEEWWAKIQK